MNLVASTNCGGTLASFEALHRFALLEGVELRRAAHFHAVRLCALPGLSVIFPALRCARVDQLALKLGQPRQNGKHEAAVWLHGVCPCVAERAEAASYELLMSIGLRRSLFNRRKFLENFEQLVA